MSSYIHQKYIIFETLVMNHYTYSFYANIIRYIIVTVFYLFKAYRWSFNVSSNGAEVLFGFRVFHIIFVIMTLNVVLWDKTNNIRFSIWLDGLQCLLLSLMVIGLDNILELLIITSVHATVCYLNKNGKYLTMEMVTKSLLSITIVYLAPERVYLDTVLIFSLNMLCFLLSTPVSHFFRTRPNKCIDDRSLSCYYLSSVVVSLLSLSYLD
jgi:hypothetical protein